MRLGRDEREPLKLVHIFFSRRRLYQIEEDLRSTGQFFDPDPFVPVLRASLPSLVLLYAGLKVAGMREESTPEQPRHRYSDSLPSGDAHQHCGRGNGYHAKFFLSRIFVLHLSCARGTNSCAELNPSSPSCSPSRR